MRDARPSADTAVAPPFFSIVTVTRNAEGALVRTARSVKGQSFGNYEWLVIDGASTDATVAVAQRYLGPNDRLVSERDNGIFDAMNKGLGMARGDYVVFMNADDMFASDATLQLVADFIATQAPPPDIVYGDSWLETAHENRVLRRARPPKTSIWRGMPAMHQAMFFRRVRHLDFPYSDRFQFTADYGAVAAMLAHGVSCAYLQTPLSVNELTGIGFSIVNKRRADADHWRIQRDILGVPLLQRVGHIARRRATVVVVELSRSRLLAPLVRLLPWLVRKRLY